MPQHNDCPYHIYGRGTNRWSWSIFASKDDPVPAESGEVSGARAKAVDAACAAIDGMLRRRKK